MPRANTALLLLWLAGSLFIFMLPQVSIYAKIAGVQIYLTLIYILMKNIFKIYDNMTYNLSKFIIITNPSIFIVIFLSKLLHVSNIISILMMILSSIVVLFIPGAVILMLAYSTKHTLSSIDLKEFIVLSYILSLAVASLAAFAIPYKQVLISFYISILIVFIHLMFIKYRDIIINKNLHISNYFDIFAILLSIILLQFILYPEISFIPGYDITRHYSKAALYALSPTPNHIRGPYPAFWTHLAIIYIIAGYPNPFIFNSILEIWTIILIITFYMFVEKCYDKIHALLATFIYTFGSGLGWLYVLKLAAANIEWTRRITEVWIMTGTDVGYGMGTWLWFWYRPFTIGTEVLILFTYYMVCRHDSTSSIKAEYIAALSAYILNLYHPSDIILSIIIILSILIFYDLNDRVLLAFIIGLLISMIIKVIYADNILSNVTFIVASIILIIIVKKIAEYIKKIIYGITSIYKSIRNTSIIQKMYLAIIVTIILSIYIYLIDSSALRIHPFHLRVPFYYYVIELGVPGILALAALLAGYKFGGKVRYVRQIDRVLISIGLLSVLAGRIVTYVNDSQLLLLILKVFGNTYYERRIIASLLFPVVCVFASRLLINILKYINIKNE